MKNQRKGVEKHQKNLTSEKEEKELEKCSIPMKKEKNQAREKTLNMTQQKERRERTNRREGRVAPTQPE